MTIIHPLVKLSSPITMSARFSTVISFSFSVVLHSIIWIVYYANLFFYIPHSTVAIHSNPVMSIENPMTNNVDNIPRLLHPIRMSMPTYVIPRMATKTVTNMNEYRAIITCPLKICDLHVISFSIPFAF